MAFEEIKELAYHKGYTRLHIDEEISSKRPHEIRKKIILIFL
ncbi:hypothetical protein [Urechidicola vernalis]|uniref:Uncharacterized protein n=1 Tax=Urechidicola vernalis TaxID=3075600 RepID=A0ABU2Y1K9_9FLAO|nr:hypothetical protein [Urechidicola sp. P050]MDT0552093.1 hypothetical protein [Urechidicola sp. P050]